jgi:hypothetical protein
MRAICLLVAAERSKKYLVCGDKYWRRNGKLRLAIRHTDGDPLLHESMPDLPMAAE